MLYQKQKLRQQSTCTKTKKFDSCVAKKVTLSLGPN